MIMRKLSIVYNHKPVAAEKRTKIIAVVHAAHAPKLPCELCAGLQHQVVLSRLWTSI